MIARTLRAAGVGLLLAAMAPLWGCYQYAFMNVHVRDRDTRAPIPNATVRVSNTSLLNPARPDAAVGETDARGEVRLRVALYNRLLVRIDAPGHSEHLLNADHPAEFGATEWFGPNVNEDGQRATIEVRLTP